MTKVKEQDNSIITEDNPISFENTDKFNRREFAESLTRAIETFYAFEDGAYVLSLNAKYGTGKTTFLKMWQNLLASEKYKHNVIYINAWETDFNEEPLIPIVSNILNSISDEKKFKNIKASLKAALTATMLTGNALADKVTGINMKDVVEGTQSIMEDKSIQSLGDEIYKEFSFKEKAYQTLKIEIKKYIEEMGDKPIFIFIDELDRVRPNYAIEFLEAIKHIFSIKGLCFVLAVDRNQLESSARQLYGNIDFENYYLRFITRETYLPSHGKISWNSFIKDNTDLYFSEEFTKRAPIQENSRNTILGFIEMCALSFSLKPRVTLSIIKTFFQIISIELTDSRNLRPDYLEATFFLTTLMFVNRELYDKLGDDTASPVEIFNYITGLNFSYPEHNSYRRKILYLVMAYLLNEKNTKEIGRLMAEYNGAKAGSEGFEESKSKQIQSLTSITEGGYFSICDDSSFKRLYSKIEKWEDFLKIH
jgi:hypothetical protein